MISSVYNNKNNIPVNKQAVKEFLKDHESVAPDFSYKRNDYNVCIKYFKKAVDKLREPNDDEISIDLVDYERICISLMKQQTKPYKYKKLLGYVMHIAKCNRKVAMLVVKKMRDERFINVIGEYVESF